MSLTCRRSLPSGVAREGLHLLVNVNERFLQSYF